MGSFKSSEFTRKIEVKVSSEKSFGIVFAVFFLVIGLYPILGEGDLRIWSVGLAIVFVLLAYLAPKTLVIPNKLWFKLGLVLGIFVTPLVMGIIYFTVVVPIGLVMKFLGKDPLHKKLDKNAKTYWTERIHPIGSMKDQF